MTSICQRCAGQATFSPAHPHLESSVRALAGQRVPQPAVLAGELVVVAAADQPMDRWVGGGGQGLGEEFVEVGFAVGDVDQEGFWAEWGQLLTGFQALQPFVNFPFP